MRTHLFMSGEFRVTMPVVFERESWQHTMSARRLVEEDGKLRRTGTHEDLKGVVYYANAEDDAIEEHNLRLLAELGTPCWPPPSTLLGMLDRHEVMARCVARRMVDHRVLTLRPWEAAAIDIPYPYVVKTGNAHSGQGKHLVTRPEEIPPWEGWATVEPFFEGESWRVLLVGDTAFGIHMTNDSSWIKNSPGAETELVVGIDGPMVEHAKRVRDLFELEVAGVDYVVGKDGTFHFLEINQFPGVDVGDEATPVIAAFLRAKMDEVERAAGRRARASGR